MRRNLNRPLPSAVAEHLYREVSRPLWRRVGGPFPPPAVVLANGTLNRALRAIMNGVRPPRFPDGITIPMSAGPDRLSSSHDAQETP